jgi:hypothetical protein
MYKRDFFIPTPLIVVGHHQQYWHFIFQYGGNGNVDKCFHQLISNLMYQNITDNGSSSSEFEAFFQSTSSLSHPDSSVGAAAAHENITEKCELHRENCIVFM